MKKSTLLSLLTAASIVVTTAVTYAVWDTTTDDTTASVTFRNPVTVTVDPTYSLTTTGAAAIGEIPTASGDVTFKIDNQGNLAQKLTLKPEISGGNNATINDFDLKITDKNNQSKSLTGDATNGFVDTSLDSTVYTVTVTPKDGTQSKTAGTAVKIKLTATLS